MHIRGQNVTQGLLQVFALAVCHLFRHGMVPAGLTGQVMSLRVHGNGNRDELIDTTQASIQFSIALMGRGITRGVFNDDALKKHYCWQP